MADFASVTRLTQTGFNDGIQELNVYMDNDTAIPQQWKWPDCRHEGDAGSFSLHDIYVRLFEAGMDSDELYLFVTTSAKQVGGKTLSQAAPQPAAEPETSEEDTGTDDASDDGDADGDSDAGTDDAGADGDTSSEEQEEEQEENEEDKGEEEQEEEEDEDKDKE